MRPIPFSPDSGFLWDVRLLLCLRLQAGDRLAAAAVVVEEEPAYVEPGAVVPGYAEPGAVVPGYVEPGAVVPGYVEPGAVVF
jgi:hypothetical protein